MTHRRPLSNGQRLSIHIGLVGSDPLDLACLPRTRDRI